ncbi:1-(5-phosphoribosyl)-5-amino-4-imidazole-carboxylate carboxylase [Rhodococcus sp. ACS1]|jgi:NCAIR mutase (PurE)-related protein|uniref:nickel pincer cofactor biosynthesis protein LarB n=1 Tax=unclassified Rhodococcus (in: high G+C Gram-positive bacteria) TaxID=192944 RepID=UPI000769E9C2|nr:nickel pincer cofactor biosynthesis protein LarB [Rhodococcus sp. ACS1]KXF53030.1 1-(5-phosphoribosyl)-5-amino-4-imidazole-carboxylate carboxylase [Rhodococcus sp. SC4]NHU48613.1 nickel pincer cofactor biosynthesis protein LarB [Rhodococcus sp. A14]PBC35252.1 1-(5-phosphoribosyl)-5-amino-4-imidazole-carboxylate carboxylase [Rhodococcus sp. ACS1]
MSVPVAENFTVDFDRERRQGLPEVVYGPGKTVVEIVRIVRLLLETNSGPVLVTRVPPDVAAEVMAGVEDGVYDHLARLLVWRPAGRRKSFTLGVVTAGTADGPVAAEAIAVAAAIGLAVTDVRDVGVAGLHRLMARIDEIRRFDAVVVVAGMEGALASVLGGLVAAPVICVPTSTGYGAALEGITALMAMMTSCAAGMTVVNIDSGFGAAMAAHRLSMLCCRPRAHENGRS